MRKSYKYIIKTDKGYICEKNAKGTYKVGNGYYNTWSGCWINAYCSRFTEVDKLGFTSDKEEATKFCHCVENRVKEILEVIAYGCEDIKEISLIRVEEK